MSLGVEFFGGGWIVHPGGGLLQFPPMPVKPIISQVGSLGSWGTRSDRPKAVCLVEFNARYGWILESRIYQQGGIEVSPLLVQPLLSRLLSSARSHGLLCSMDITQEISSGGRGEIFHKLCGCEYSIDMWARNEVSEKM